MASHRIVLLPGDGIGPEVISAAAEVLVAVAQQVADIDLDLVEARIGAGALADTGSAFPEESLELARGADAVLHGASDNAAVPADVLSPLRALRRGLEVHSNLRPIVTLPGVPSVHDDIDILVVRENTEGMYSHSEYTIGRDIACSVRVITRAATERVARTAFEAARRRRGLVTTVHKLGGLPIGDGLWLDAVDQVATEFPEVTVERRNIDAAAAELVTHPHAFDVLLAENQYGDILSDVGAAVAGGLGLAASGCIGERWAYFEPIHGSAPDIAGRGIANPSGAILAGAMLLEHLGEARAAATVIGAVRGVLASHEAVTPDLGGTSGTQEFTQAVIGGLGSATC